MKPTLTSLDHLVLTVADIDATCAFYADVLGMQVEVFEATDGTTRRALRFGQQKINLHEAGHEFLPNARAATPGSADLCFLTGRRLSLWESHLAEKGIEIIEGPVRRNGAAGRILSIYIRDPDGNLVEIATRAA
ncbi:VOC family protein [Mesobacterium pallidum]|uniref:VOC family protein n=1 Tax=Mesobacterium pallidum TaxID=2872037 RepID=UPI001EE2B2E1|nr:VOC family protein [Mesobacterium pallidum]